MRFCLIGNFTVMKQTNQLKLPAEALLEISPLHCIITGSLVQVHYFTGGLLWT